MSHQIKKFASEASELRHFIETMDAAGRQIPEDLDEETLDRWFKYKDHRTAARGLELVGLLAETLDAIEARIQGIRDHPALLKFEPILPNTQINILHIIAAVRAEIDKPPEFIGVPLEGVDETVEIVRTPAVQPLARFGYTIGFDREDKLHIFQRWVHAWAAVSPEALNDEQRSIYRRDVLHRPD